MPRITSIVRAARVVLMIAEMIKTVFNLSVINVIIFITFEYLIKKVTHRSIVVSLQHLFNCLLNNWAFFVWRRLRFRCSRRTKWQISYQFAIFWQSLITYTYSGVFYELRLSYNFTVDKIIFGISRRNTICLYRCYNTKIVDQHGRSTDSDIERCGERKIDQPESVSNWSIW